jgi:hypothetical protein
MGNSTLAILVASIAASYLPGPLATSRGPTPDEAKMPLGAVVKRASDVFASTPAGLFRAPLTTMHWERLNTLPEMPLGGTFAGLPPLSPLVVYIANRWQLPLEQRRPAYRYGLYLSNDDGTTWQLISQRDNYGATLLLPDGALFAVTVADGGKDRVLRSPDLGRTWRDITGGVGGRLKSLEPDPDHPGLIRVRGWALRDYTFFAEDENYRWRGVRGLALPNRRRSSDEFFRRLTLANRMPPYRATLSNYFQRDFGNQTSLPALDIVPRAERFEFARGDRVLVPVDVVLYDDPNAALLRWRQAAAAGNPGPQPAPPSVKFADQPDTPNFWGLRVETSSKHFEMFPPRRGYVTPTGTATGDSRPPVVAYRVFDLSRSSPYARKIDLGRIIADVTRPGEYRVQILYDSHEHADQEKGEWNGVLTSPVFTVVIRG